MFHSVYLRWAVTSHPVGYTMRCVKAEENYGGVSLCHPAVVPKYRHLLMTLGIHHTVTVRYGKSCNDVVCFRCFRFESRPVRRLPCRMIFICYFHSQTRRIAVSP